MPTAPIDDKYVARTSERGHTYLLGRNYRFSLCVWWLAHAILRKSAPNADPFLLPFTALLSGLGLMLIYSVKDPYRDTLAFTGQVWGVDAVWNAGLARAADKAVRQAARCVAISTSTQAPWPSC